MAIANIRAQAESKIRKGPPCEVCSFIQRLSGPEAAALRSLLADPTVRYSVISEGLEADPDYGVDIPAITLSRHARGKCHAKDKLR